MRALGMSDQTFRWTATIGLLFITAILILFNLQVAAFIFSIFSTGAVLNTLIHESEPTNLHRK